MAGAGVLAIMVVPTNHQASGQVLLLPPSKPAPAGSVTNPYLNMGLAFTASLVASSVSTLDEQRDMADSGYESDYSVSVVPGAGPLIVISVEDTVPAAALATRDELISRIEAELLFIQDREDVPSSQIIIPRLFGVSQQAEVLAGNKLRALVLILVVGTVLTALVVVNADRRAMRRESNQPAPTTPVRPAPSEPVNGASTSDAVPDGSKENVSDGPSALRTG
jgi:hypothetical protein